MRQFLHIYNNMKTNSLQYLKNLCEVLLSPFTLLRWIIAWSIVGMVWWYFMDIELIIWNQWHVIAYTEITLFILFVLLFALFVAISVYKLLYFSINQWKQLSMWSIWSFFAMIAVWCPACSITLASYLGLASLLSIFPYWWLELKIAWIMLLAYAIRSSLKSLHTCSLEQKKIIDINRCIRVSSYVIWALVCLRVIVDYASKQWWFNL
jgi:hypothetical protein